MKTEWDIHLTWSRTVYRRECLLDGIISFSSKKVGNGDNVRVIASWHDAQENGLSCNSPNKYLRLRTRRWGQIQRCCSNKWNGHTADRGVLETRQALFIFKALVSTNKEIFKKDGQTNRRDTGRKREGKEGKGRGKRERETWYLLLQEVSTPG